MYCPNCGNKNSVDQRFCRSCGLGLEKVTQSLTEQLPNASALSLQQQKQKFERLGMAALSVFGLGVLSFILYSVFYKLMVSEGRVLAALGVLGFLIMIGCGLASVILFAKANDVKEVPASRINPKEVPTERSTQELLSEAKPAPLFSVADRTTDLLPVHNENEKRASLHEKTRDVVR
ncbi:MAG TPA: zinc ribbon domain-containing protein [Pyrinomonadaceae bacterium]